MVYGQVQLLQLKGIGFGHAYAYIAYTFKFSARFACKSY